MSLLAGIPDTAPDLTLPMPVFLLLCGLSFLAGFALGMIFEYANLRLRERELVRGRRLLAEQARGLRQQLLAFYRLRGAAGHNDWDSNRTPDGSGQGEKS